MIGTATSGRVGDPIPLHVSKLAHAIEGSALDPSGSGCSHTRAALAHDRSFASDTLNPDEFGR